MGGRLKEAAVSSLELRMGEKNMALASTSFGALGLIGDLVYHKGLNSYICGTDSAAGEEN